MYNCNLIWGAYNSALSSDGTAGLLDRAVAGFGLSVLWLIVVLVCTAACNWAAVSGVQAKFE